MNVIFSIIFFIISLGILVGIHEFGHFIVAKKSGVYCHEFALGFGPKIWTYYRDKVGTNYTIRALPLGGFVSMASTQERGPDEPVYLKNLDESQFFESKKPLVRIAILIAGATMNFILAISIYFAITFFVGVPTNDPVFVVAEDTPLSSEIEAGTVIEIEQINDEVIETNEDAIAALQMNETNYTIAYCEESEQCENLQNVTVTPTETGKIGIVGKTTYENNYNVLLSLENMLTQFQNAATEIFKSLYSLVSGETGLSNLSGPIGIFTVSSQVASSRSSVTMLLFIAFLSVNLGIFNLLPIPALDGGRIAFVLYELITRKKASPKVELIVTAIGFAFLITLVIYASINDIIRIGS